MLTNEELLDLNLQGFIPGPKETEYSFIKRVNFTKQLFEDPKKFFEEKAKMPPFRLVDRLKQPDKQWAKTSLLNFFDVSANYFSAYFNNEKLKIFQGAATWLLEFEGITLPILQIRKNLKKGSFLKIYELEDILAHELAHFARAGFNEPKYEEFFAYFTSSSLFRKIFGPIAISSVEIILFLTFLFISLSNQYLNILFKQSIFNILFLVSSYLASKMIFAGFIRLGYRRWMFNRCLKRLTAIFKDKNQALSVMFRLTDKEINDFAKKEAEQIKEYTQANKDSSLRWKVIYLAYFTKLQTN